MITTLLDQIANLDEADAERHLTEALLISGWQQLDSTEQLNLLRIWYAGVRPGLVPHSSLCSSGCRHADYGGRNSDTPYCRIYGHLDAREQDAERPRGCIEREKLYVCMAAEAGMTLLEWLELTDEYDR